MRILLVTDSPFGTSAYGGQGKWLARRLLDAGHAVRYFATTYFGERLTVDGVDVVGGVGPSDLFGAWTMDWLARDFEADIILTLKDVYVYDGRALRELQTPWVPLVCVDTEPLALAVRAQLHHAMAVLCPTRVGQELLAAEQIASAYTPLAVDVDFWAPGDKAAARAQLGLPADGFVALFVGDNQTVPSRKGLAQLVLAWHVFLAQVDADAVLYLHTSLDGHRGGVNVRGILHAAGIPRANWQATDKVEYESQAVPPAFVRTLYQAADVLVGPSTGEGFWLPGVEAMACGVPVIGTDFAAQRETAAIGWRIPVTEANGETVWSELGAFRFRANRRAIVAALRAAWEHRGDVELGKAARKAALPYAIDRVFETFWRPALARVEALLEGDLGLSDEDATGVERARGDRPAALHAEPRADRPMAAGGIPGVG